MLHWLLQSTRDYPGLAEGIAPGGLLSAGEATRLAELKTAKRRRDWLLGRFTAKRLLQQVICQTTGRTVPLETIIIGNDATGAPYAYNCLTGQQYSLSISHRSGHAFCAAASGESWPVGADIEQIEPRPAGFAADYFTPAESALLACARQEQKELLVTTIWSAKEAALKALHLGLTVDTRAVTCLIEPSSVVPGRWQPFSLYTNRQLLQRPAPPLQGWWQHHDKYVLTMVAQQFLYEESVMGET